MEEQEFYEIIDAYSVEYRNLLKAEFEERLQNVKLDLSKSGEYEVIWGLVSRQCSFVNEISYSPLTWNTVFMPIIMRCMVENYINLSWILISPTERSKAFIKYGLGRETKILEFAKNKPNKTEVDLDFINQNESWINQQSFTFLNEINLGGLKNKEFTDVRKTAQEAKEKEYYDLFYDVCSSATHSTWNYIGKHNLKICENPLHKNHRIPIIKEPEIEVHLFLVLAKIMSDTFGKTDGFYKINLTGKSSFEYLEQSFRNSFQARNAT